MRAAGASEAPGRSANNETKGRIAAPRVSSPLPQRDVNTGGRLEAERRSALVSHVMRFSHVPENIGISNL